MKEKNLIYPFILMLMSVFLICGCGNNNEDSILGENEDNNPNIPVTDPEGTISMNILNNGETFELGNYGYNIVIDAGNNFKNESSSLVEFVDLGKMRGLGNITSIPIDGWSSSVSVKPEHGYVIYFSSYKVYVRLYVEKYLTDATGNIIGFTVKFQQPFETIIKFEKDYVNFTSESSTQIIRFKNRSSISVKSIPNWCNVSLNETYMEISVLDNLTAHEYKDEIVLSNNAGESILKITQNASSSPIFDNGRGTKDDPWQIINAKQLDNIREWGCDKSIYHYFTLMNDIDFSSYLSENGNGWEPIGTLEAPFYGSFAGNGHKLIGLWINRSSTYYVGLFGYSKQCEISGLRIELSPKGIYCNDGGGVCGHIDGNGNISQCYVKGNIFSSGDVGGIVGFTRGGKISECYTEGNITAEGFGCAGGICGYSQGTVENCYSKANIKSQGTRPSGGIIGDFYGTAIYCYTIGNIEGNGIFGISSNYKFSYYNKEITNCTSGGTGLTTSQMKKQSSYENWDFNKIWQIEENKSYPSLRCFNN